MITNLLFDFSRVILFPKDESYNGSLNDLYRNITNEKKPFPDYFKFNDELLEYLSSLKEKFVLSVYTTDIVQNDPEAQKEIEPIFKNIFSANDLGINKNEPEGYLAIAAKLQVDPTEILFVDDGAENIGAAHNAGLETIQYFSNIQLFRDLQSKLQI